MLPILSVSLGDPSVTTGEPSYGGCPRVLRRVGMMTDLLETSAAQQRAVNKEYNGREPVSRHAAVVGVRATPSLLSHRRIPVRSECDRLE